MAWKYTDLYNWCRERQYFYFPKVAENEEQNKDRPTTHLCLDGANGGVIKLPDAAANREFLSKYADDLDAGHTEPGKAYYISEQRTPIFKFYFDLDIKRKELVNLINPATASAAEAQEAQETQDNLPMFVQSLDRESIDFMVLQYCRDMLEVIKLFYPPTTDKKCFTMIVCRRENVVQQETSGPKMVNIGVHAILPFLYVTADQALVMRGAALGKFRQIYGLMDQVQNPWEEILDEAVYVGNGLRMIGSRKAVKCPDCKADPAKKLTCRTCMKQDSPCPGKIDVGRVYEPWLVLAHDGTPDASLLAQLRRNTHKLIEVTSVRLYNVDTTPDWKPYEGCPSVPTTGEDSFVEVEIDGKMVRRFKEDAGVISKIRNKIYLPRDPQKFQEVETYLRGMVNPKYRSISVDQIFTSPKGAWFIINVTGDGSSFCMNLNRDHKNNKIYFLLTKDGIYQKCYCRCPTLQGRRFGYCKNYTSKRYEIPEKLLRLFFKVDDSRDVNKIFMEERNDTLKRTKIHTHMRSVDRAVNFLRARLREMFEERKGIRQLPAKFNTADNPTGAPPLKKRKTASAGAVAIPVDSSAGGVEKNRPRPPKKKAKKSQSIATTVSDLYNVPVDEDYSCP